MTDRTEEIRARLEGVTPGPWGNYPESPDCYVVWSSLPVEHVCLANVHAERGKLDAAFIAAARQDIPYLLELNDAKDAEIERLREDLKSHKAMMLEAAEEFEKMKAALRGRFGV